MKKAIFSFVLVSVLCGLTCDSSAVVVFVDHYADCWSETSNMIVYNETDANISLTGDDNWGHGDITDANNNGPMKSHTARVDENIELKSSSKNKGNLNGSIKDSDGTYTFSIGGANPHHYTQFTLTCDSGFTTSPTNDTDQTQDQDPDSGAWPIADPIADNGKYLGGLVSQCYGNGYVITLIGYKNMDNCDSSKYSGNGAVILLITYKWVGSFKTEPVKKAAPDSFVNGVGCNGDPD